MTAAGREALASVGQEPLGEGSVSNPAAAVGPAGPSSAAALVGSSPDWLGGTFWLGSGLLSSRLISVAGSAVFPPFQ